MLISVLIGLCGLFLVTTLICLGLTINLYIEVKSMQKSTHSVQYVDPFAELNDDISDIDKANKEYLEKENKRLQDAIDNGFYTDLKGM